MNARTSMALLLALAFATQLAVPAGMIVRRELALQRGVALRFRTAPVDPYDAFRGRYVALAFNERSVPCAETFRAHQSIYVRAETGTNGFAHLAEAARRPGGTGVWFRASADYSTKGP